MSAKSFTGGRLHEKAAAGNLCVDPRRTGLRRGHPRARQGAHDGRRRPNSVQLDRLLYRRAGGLRPGPYQHHRSGSVFRLQQRPDHRQRHARLLAGGQVGCDYQFAGNWVVGLEGDFAWADIKGTVNDPFFAGKNFTSKTDAIASGTGRIGYSFDRVLFYGKGGGAWAHNRFDMTFFGGPGSATETRFGWTVGAGIEYMLAPNWSAKFEYNHYDFGSRQVSLTGTGFGGAFVVPENISQRIDTVKVGLNYRFWSAPGPVVARY